MTRFAIALLLAILTSQANAEPASADSAKKLLKITRSEAMLDSMYVLMQQSMQQSVDQSMAGKSLTPEQQRIMNAVPAKVFSAMRSELNWAKLEPQYVQLYTETFDQSEVDGLIAFYEGPAGKAFVDKMPLVLQKSAAIARSHMQAVLPQMQAIVQQAITDAKVDK